MIFQYLVIKICFVILVIINIFVNTEEVRLPIVYVYTVVAAVCPFGLPAYIKVSLEQAVLSQPDCDIYMASNYAECPKISEVIDTIEGVIKIDTTLIASERYYKFKNVSSEMFQADYGGELWVTSALRFFSLEDMMINKGYKEMVHIEADNLIYGSYTSLLKVLRAGYNGLAATPLNANKSFITASVFWIANLQAMQKFNDFLIDLGMNRDGKWKDYLTWLRPYGCCKHGGIDQDKDGNGIKPYAVNEMSMLAYYKSIEPTFFNLPVVPKYDYYLNRYICNMSEFGPNGREVGPPTGDGIWDPNSWGQYLGGTSVKKGRDKKFTDASHIAGQAMRTNYCVPHMICANRTLSATFVLNKQNKSEACYTAPFVRCGDDSKWTLLWNLHVHSKHTENFRSRPCECVD